MQTTTTNSDEDTTRNEDISCVEDCYDIAGDELDNESDGPQRQSHDMTTSKSESLANSQHTTTNSTTNRSHHPEQDDRFLMSLYERLMRTDDVSGLAPGQETDPFLKYAPSEDQLKVGMNTLHVAIWNRCSRTDLKEILNKKPELAQQVDIQKTTPMHLAFMQEDYFYRVDSLLALFNAYPKAIKMPDYRGNYPLHTAMVIIRSMYYLGGRSLSVRENSPHHMVGTDLPFGRKCYVAGPNNNGGGAGGDGGGNRGPGAPNHHGQLPLDVVLVRHAILFFIDRLLQICPEEATWSGLLNPSILHELLSRRELEYKLRQISEREHGRGRGPGWGPHPIINETACFELILRANPSTASAVERGSGRLPLHTAMADGTVPMAIIQLVLDACPSAVKERDDTMKMPLHLGIESLGMVSYYFDDKRKFPNEREAKRFRNMLEAITVVLDRNPHAASTLDQDGCTPLFQICKTLQTEHPHAHHASQVMKKILLAYPDAAEIACYWGLCPLNILVEECSKVFMYGSADSTLPGTATALTQLMERNSIFKLQTLLSAVRDGRALRTMCNLRNPVLLLALFLLFDEDHDSFKSADSNEGPLPPSQNHIPMVNLNKQLIPGWTLLEMLTDFDTVDSSNVVLQIVQRQRGKMKQDGVKFCIEYQDQDTTAPQAILHFVSTQAVQEAVLVHVADRAKLSKSSLELKRWGQQHGRMLRRYRVQQTPKHISQTCVVVFATKAMEDADGHHFESPVALKFMSQEDAFLREIEKRRGTKEEFVLPIRAFFTKEPQLHMDCDYIQYQNFNVDLPVELAQYPNICLKGVDATRDQSMLEYLLVMECGSGTDLHDVIGHQNIAGQDPFSVISIAKEIARCLQFLNERCGIIHGDVKARNFVSRGVGLVGFAAIDLDNAAAIVEGEMAGKKRTSSGYLPPEQASVEEFRRFGGLITPKDNLSIDYIKNELILKAMLAQDWPEVTRLSQQLEAQSISGQTSAPTEVVATIQYDMWCFGVLLYYLCTGIQLFNVDVREELAEQDELKKLKLWEPKVKALKLAKVGYGWPRELLEKLLEKDPSDRPKSWSLVIDELSKLRMNETGRAGHSIEQLRHDRVVVFRSDPLVYIDQESKIPKHFDRIDYEKEEDTLMTSRSDAKKGGAQIDFVFEYATTDALSAFFDLGTSRVLHFSGHGNKECLALENGFGQLQPMLVDDLKQYVSKSGGNLLLVVVAACHSQNTGQAFLSAGVPHVVCCRLEGPLLDTGARVFAGSLYRALACGSNLQAAFDKAREAVRVSPMVENSRSEAGNFLLLPEQGVDHDIPVFFTNPIPQLLPMDNQHQAIGVPRLPQCFVGRNVDMYHVISALRRADLVRVGGIEGVGKSCVVSAVCGYIVQRPRSFPMDYLFWLEPSSLTSTSHSSPYQELASAFQAVFEDDFLTDKSEYSLNLERLSKLLDQKRIYLVFNRCSLEIGHHAENIETFIRDLLAITSVKTIKIILLSSTKYKGTSLHGRHETSLQIRSLDPGSTAIVFSSHLPADLQSRYPNLARYLDPPDAVRQAPSFQDRYKGLWALLGKGIPGRVRTNAMNMTDEEMLTIINWWRMRPT
jgi:serine/threonine protein kinase